MNMNITKFSANKKKLALSMAGILFLLWLTQPYITKRTDSTETLSGAETIKPVTNSVSTSPTDKGVTDPFSEHIQKNGLSTKGSSVPDLGNPATTGTDPFKAFLENQNKQAQTSSVSPFGK
jgi:hypothetical protein